MTDYLPEDSYDPSSGEYSGEFDFDPIFSVRVELSSDIHAEVSADEPDFEPLTSDIADRLQDLVSGGYFDIEGNRNPNEYPNLSNSEFDTQSPNSRGPFISADQVERFLDESGLRDQVDVWYDEENDVYWVDADTGSAA